MAVEIEVKMKVQGHEPVRARLKSLGGTMVGKKEELNTFFDATDGAILATDRGLRLRENRDVESGKKSYVVTYKGRRNPGAVKRREEVEFSVDDPAAVQRVLEAIGLRVSISFEKRRESWRLGDCQIELDEVPRLGRFVEVEGPSEEEVLRVREELGLGESFTIVESYSALLAADLRRHGLVGQVVRF